MRYQYASLIILTALLLPTKQLYVLGQTLSYPAPNFTVQHKDGYNIAFNSLKGKHVFLNFWASWCPVSTIQVPNLYELYNKYNHVGFKDANGFEIMSIALDEKREAWERALKAHLETWKFHCISPMGFDSPIAQSYGVTNLPTSFLISPAGNIVMKDPSFAELDDYLSMRTNGMASNQVPTIYQTQRGTLSTFQNDNISSDLSNDITIYDSPAYQPNYTSNSPAQYSYATSNTYNSSQYTPKSNYYRIYLGTFGIPNFHNFDKLAHIGEITSIASADRKSENVFIGYFQSKDQAEIALQDVKNNGYKQAKIVSDTNKPNEVANIKPQTPSTYTQYDNNTYTPYNSQINNNALPQAAMPPVGISDTYISYSAKPYSSPNIKYYSPNPPTTYNNPPSTTTKTPTTTYNNPPSTTTKTPTTTYNNPPSAKPTNTNKATQLAPPPKSKDPNVWTIKPNPNVNNTTNTNSQALNNIDQSNTKTNDPQNPTIPNKSKAWIQELEKRGLTKQYIKNLPSANKLHKEQEKLRKKREKLMREVEQLKKQEDNIEEQIQFRNMYE